MKRTLDLYHKIRFSILSLQVVSSNNSEKVRYGCQQSFLSYKIALVCHKMCGLQHWNSIFQVFAKLLPVAKGSVQQQKVLL